MYIVDIEKMIENRVKHVDLRPVADVINEKVKKAIYSRIKKTVYSMVDDFEKEIEKEDSEFKKDPSFLKIEDLKPSDDDNQEEDLNIHSLEAYQRHCTRLNYRSNINKLKKGHPVEIFYKNFIGSVFTEYNVEKDNLFNVYECHCLNNGNLVTNFIEEVSEGFSDNNYDNIFRKFMELCEKEINNQT